MANGYIAVIDSGIGGFSVLKELVKNFPNEKFLYYGDNGNAPYGSKTREELLSLTISNLEYINNFGIKALVLACNTLSTNIMQDIKDKVNIPVFGVVPPIEEICKKYKTLLIATPKTCERFLGNDRLTVVPLPNLAKEIEDNLFSLGKIDLNKHLNRVSNDYEAVILGCTHYVLLKNEFFNHLKPRLLEDGIKNTVKQVGFYLENNKSSVNYCRNSILFVGKNADKNYIFWKNVVNL